MLEKAVVFLIVAVCAFFFIRRVMRQFTKPSSGCGCVCTGCDQDRQDGDKQPPKSLSSPGESCCNTGNGKTGGRKK